MEYLYFGAGFFVLYALNSIAIQQREQTRADSSHN
jgi:hypothetical protein